MDQNYLKSLCRLIKEKAHKRAFKIPCSLRFLCFCGMLMAYSKDLALCIKYHTKGRFAAYMTKRGQRLCNFRP